MFPFKDRVKTQIQESILKFDNNFENKSKKLSEHELKELNSFPDKIKDETFKGIGIGLAFGLFFFANMRKVPTISKKQRIFYITAPVIIIPYYYYISWMQKFNFYKLCLALKMEE